MHIASNMNSLEFHSLFGCFTVCRLTAILTFTQEPTRITSEISSDPNAGPQLVIWGTDVMVSHCKEKFKRFICKYVDTNVADDEQFEGMDISQPYYLQRLEEVCKLKSFRSGNWTGRMLW